MVWHSDPGGWTRRFRIEEVTGVWASGPGDVWFAGDHGVEHFDGTTATPAPIAAANFETYTKVWGSGPGDVWIVGGIEN